MKKLVWKVVVVVVDVVDVVVIDVVVVDVVVASYCIYAVLWLLVLVQGWDVVAPVHVVVLQLEGGLHVVVVVAIVSAVVAIISNVVVVIFVAIMSIVVVVAIIPVVFAAVAVAFGFSGEKVVIVCFFVVFICNISNNSLSNRIDCSKACFVDVISSFTVVHIIVYIAGVDDDVFSVVILEFVIFKKAKSGSEMQMTIKVPCEEGR